MITFVPGQILTADELNQAFADTAGTGDGLTIMVSGGVISVIYGSGTTSQRPLNNLQIGLPFFDITLGIPVFWNGTEWVNSAGISV